ncbi:gp22 prohead core scaffold protein [Synechococcus phage S-CBM2]|nr:gp22 prohead core scaffold protein [Synechococcus phage S-CBM2]
MSQETELQYDMELDENVVTKGAKPAEKSSLKNEAEDLGGPDVKTVKPDSESAAIGKRAAGKAGKASAPTTKPSDASSKMEEVEAGEEVIAEDEEFDGYELVVDVSADVAALTEGEDLSEEFKAKAATIFEAAVKTKIQEELEMIHEAYEETLEEELTKTREELAEKVDEFLNYVASQWMSENELAIEHGIKNEIAENLINGMKSLFTENYIEVPEEKFDLFDDMVEKLDEMEAKLNEQIEVNVGLNRQLGEQVKHGIVAQIADGLADTQKEKLAGLAENVEFESEDQYREKVEMLKESYFHREASMPTEDTEIDQSVAPGSSMDVYVRALGRWS